MNQLVEMINERAADYLAIRNKELGFGVKVRNYILDYTVTEFNNPDSINKKFEKIIYPKSVFVYVDRDIYISLEEFEAFQSTGITTVHDSLT
jgi:hypothetical protein